MNWPAYFQPASPHTHATATGHNPQPICLLDAFYLASADCAPELFAVAGLDGGGLCAIHAPDIHTLPDVLQRQLRAALVSRRGALRTLQASQLFLLTLDSIEQREMSGLNDAVLLFGRAGACLECTLGAWQITPLAQPGALTVGRLDVLHGYALGFEEAWRNPEASGDYLSHLFLSAGSVDEVRGGHSLALAYPMFEPEPALALHRADNTALMLRLIYDLLLKLQQDLGRSGNTQDFVKAVLPVPSRQRLEIELAAEGYEVRGNEAVRVGKAQPDAQSDFLQRLRRWAAGWSAPRIALPPQARPRVYRDLVMQALALAANEQDKAMLTAMAQRLQPQVKARRTSKSPAQPNQQKRKAKEPAPAPRKDAPEYEVTPRFDEALSQPLPPTKPVSQVRAPKGDDWSKDFGKPSAPKQPEMRPEDWAGDFEG